MRKILLALALTAFASAAAAQTVFTTGGPSVTSITGTANQITASASTGAVTLSLPSAVIAPGSLEVTTTTLLDGATTVSGASFGLSGAISAPTWTTNGVRYKNVAATLTDTTAATGTTATAYTDVWGGNTIVATNASVVFTNYYGSYFKAPAAGTNVTLTNSWAIGADSLNVGTSGVFKVSTAGVLTTTGAQFTTPTLGVATGTSLALGGAIIGPDALGVTGTVTFYVSGSTKSQAFGSDGSLQLVPNGSTLKVGRQLDVAFNHGGIIGMPSTMAFGWTSTVDGGDTVDTFLGRQGAASLRIGAVDVDTAPVAQTLRTQGALAGGTSNVAGANWTFIASPGKGAGVGGSIIFQTAPAGSTGTTVNAPATVLTLDSTKLATFSGQINVTAMTQTSAAQSGTNCYNSATGAMTYDATLGCLTSLEETKNIQPGGIPEALPEIMALKPFWFSWKDKPLHHDNDYQPGLGAHATEKVDVRLVGYGPDGKLRGVRYTEMVALLVAGMQQQQRDIDELKRRAGVPANDNFWTRLKWIVGK